MDCTPPSPLVCKWILAAQPARAQTAPTLRAAPSLQAAGTSSAPGCNRLWTLNQLLFLASYVLSPVLNHWGVHASVESSWSRCPAHFKGRMAKGELQHSGCSCFFSELVTLSNLLILPFEPAKFEACYDYWRGEGVLYRHTMPSCKCKRTIDKQHHCCWVMHASLARVLRAQHLTVKQRPANRVHSVQGTLRLRGGQALT